jgi:hypothetical protein
MAGVDLLTVRDLGGGGEGWARYGRAVRACGSRTKREAVEALARGGRLARTGTQPSGTQSGTELENESRGDGR